MILRLEMILGVVFYKIKNMIFYKKIKNLRKTIFLIMFFVKEFFYRGHIFYNSTVYNFKNKE